MGLINKFVDSRVLLALPCLIVVMTTKEDTAAMTGAATMSRHVQGHRRGQAHGVPSLLPLPLASFTIRFTS